MTTYKEIFGKPVKFLSTDPSNAEAEGQIWYNSTSGSFKSVVVGAAWSSGAPLINANSYNAMTGTQTAALSMAGFDGVGPTTNRVEEYNGSGWSAGTALPTATYGGAGAGTQTAALFFGGNPAIHFSYDGATWTSINPLTTARSYLRGLGTQTAAIGVGGQPATTNGDKVEEYDGTSFAASTPLNTGRRNGALGGASSSSVLFFGGNQYPPTARTGATEEWNGSTWTTVNPMTTARASLGGAGVSVSAALGFSGTTTVRVTATEEYNGSDWSNAPNMATGRSNLGGCGSQTAAIGAAGSVPPYSSLTEEYNKSASVITPGAWASGGNMNTGRYLLAGTNAPGSTASALLGFGGYGPAAGTPSAATESYDGSSWTTETNLPAAASRNFGTGTLTAALQAGGLSPPTTNLSASNEWNGSSWTAGNPINEARGQSGAFGIQTASVIVGGARFFGSPPPADVRSTVEEYDGTSWAAGTATPVATRNRGGAGILTAGIAWAGINSPDGSWPGSTTNETLLYDGTTWTTGGNFNNPSPTSFTGGGTQTAAWSARHPNASHEQYNGTTWATAPNTASSAGAGASGSGQTSAVVFAGYDTAPTTATEEFTGETSANNFKTLTTS